MFIKRLMTLIFAGFCASASASFIEQTEVTGADMAGIEVTAYFEDGTSETVIWEATGEDSGGVTGTGWSLTQSGYTLGDYQDGEVLGSWSFTNDSGTVTSFSISPGDTGLLFDTDYIESLADDTNGSGQGRSFFSFTDLTEYDGVSGSYYDNVTEELYESLFVDITDTGVAFEFWADTDFQTIVVEIVDDLSDEAGDDADALAEEIDDDTTAEELVAAITSADNDDNVVATAIEALATVDGEIDSELLEEIASTILTSDSDILNEVVNYSAETVADMSETALEIVEEIIEQEVKEDWSVTGNGDINVEIDETTGETSIGLVVDDETATEEPIVFANEIDTPDSAFDIVFDLFFETETGSLEVWLADVLLATYEAEYFLESTTVTIQVTDEELFSLTDVELAFVLYPGSPATAYISTLDITNSSASTTDVPEPPMIALLMIGLAGLALRKKKLVS